MKPTYFALLTEQGEAKLAQAIANKTTLKLTEMAIGDGGDAVPQPDRQQTRLVNEQRRAAINTLFVDPMNTYQLVAEQIIPEEDGGWWIREIGLLDEDGDLCAIANCPPTYKPKLAEGSGRTQIIRLVLSVTSADVVELKIDPAIVLATRQYVDQGIDDIREHFAPLKNPVFKGKPTAPTPESDENSEQLATTAFVHTVQEIVGQRYVTPQQGDERYVKRDEKLFPDLQNGYQRLPSGLILQWGLAQIGPYGSELWFPQAFPNGALSIQLSHNSPEAGFCLCQQTRDATKFWAAGVTHAGNHYGAAISWLAIGY